MKNLELEGFWSYVREDNEADEGRILRLANDVKKQFGLLTGEPLTLFIDKDALEWGDKWRDKINLSLAKGTFFVPILTPRYFLSVECIREMRYFIETANILGTSKLIMPIHYVEVPALSEETPENELIALINELHWEDWRQLRLADPHTERYRSGVWNLVKRLQEASLAVENVDILANYEAMVALDVTGVSSKHIQNGNKEIDDSLGSIDKLACFEETMKDKLPETLKLITNDVNLIGSIMQEGTSEIHKGNERGKGFASRLRVARKVAKQLEEPVERIWSNSSAFATQLHEVDTGIRIFIERAPIEVEEKPEYRENFCKLFNSVRAFSKSIKTSLQSTQGMIDTTIPLEEMSKDLRPVIRRLRSGLTNMVEAGKVSEEWVQLIEESGIECGDVDVNTNANDS